MAIFNGQSADYFSPRPGASGRIPTLDGYRGLASLMVLLSHYFAEVPHGIHAMMFGWVGVDIFFVLSGFLIGKEILSYRSRANFLPVFYVRRFFRIVPIYVITLVVVSGLIKVLPQEWAQAATRFPLWSYLATVQGLFMVATQSIGALWLLPTWTLAVEVHFYLAVPATIMLIPRRWLVHGLVALILAVVVFRAAIFFGGLVNGMAGLALLPGRADLFIWGILAAIAIGNPKVNWTRCVMFLRLSPIAMLLVAICLRLVGSSVFQVFGPTVVGLGCAAFLLCLTIGTPEAPRFNSGILRFFGENAYCVYLIHLPVLGVMHGLILGATPDLTTPAQWIVTLASLPVCVLIAVVMTRYIEAPLTRFGRQLGWSIGARNGLLDESACTDCR